VHNCHARILKLFDDSRTSADEIVQAHLKDRSAQGVVISIDGHRALPPSERRGKLGPLWDDYMFKVSWLDGDRTEEPAKHIGKTGVYRKYCLQHGLKMMSVDPRLRYEDPEVQPAPRQPRGKRAAAPVSATPSPVPAPAPAPAVPAPQPNAAPTPAPFQFPLEDITDDE
jgi:hypothetical protein